MSTLEQIRKDSADKWTARALSKALGVSPPTYYKLEKDPSLMTIRQIEALSEYTGLSVEVLLGEQDDGLDQLASARQRRKKT